MVFTDFENRGSPARDAFGVGTLVCRKQDRPSKNQEQIEPDFFNASRAGRALIINSRANSMVGSPE